MHSTESIYLDYAAATPMDKRVFVAMEPYFTEKYYNPSALYRAAQQVRGDVSASRHAIAKVLGVHAQDVIFTAGATESINMAVYGVLQKYGGNLVTSSIEHEAVLAAAGRHESTLVDADERGYIDPEAIARAIDDDTSLVSVGFINNELGTVQSLKQIAQLITTIREKRRETGNGRPLWFHTDASQAAGVIDLSVSRLGIDMMTLNASKCYGPKQVGLLWRSPSIELEPLLVGGGQENGARSGTENIAGIIGFSKALQLASDTRKSESQRLLQLRSMFIEELQEALPDVVINGHPKRYAPHIVHFSVSGVDGERVVYALDHRGVMVATGSACAANRATGSHVLKAVCMDQAMAEGSIRVSFGRYTTEEEIRQAVPRIAAAIEAEKGL